MTHPSAERIVELYDRNAEQWASQRGDTLTEENLLSLLTERLAVGAHVLDVGCGSGRPVARHLMDQGLVITGVDSSARLIEMARDQFPNGEWVVMDMRQLDLGRRFDAIIAWYSLFHLSPEDQRKMFARFAEHAKPGAYLLTITGPAHGDKVGEWLGEPLYHGSLSPDEYCERFDEQGFDVLTERYHEPERGRGITWLARKRS